MKEKDCKAIRRQIEETNLGQELNALAITHVRQCNACLEFYESRNKLRQIVASLAPVEAPADFDFRLRARIANERLPLDRRWSISSLSLGFPSAIAVLVLLAGVVFVLRSVIGSWQAHPVTVSRPDEAAPHVMPPERDSKTLDLATVDGGKNAANERPASQDKHQTAQGRREWVVTQSPRRIATKESSNLGATVVKQEESVAQLPLIFPLQTLRVSLDDGSGVSRTISIPTVSFGSQRVWSPAASNLQPAAKGVW